MALKHLHASSGMAIGVGIGGTLGLPKRDEFAARVCGP